MSKFSIKERLLSFKYAFEGLNQVFKSEHNAWIHIGLATFAIALSFYFEISSCEWTAIIICISIVISAEIFNTAIEHIANFIQPDKDDRIKVIKDLAAAGVLIAAIGSLIVGLVIFVPLILALWGV